MKFQDQDALIWRDRELFLEQIPVPQITADTEALVETDFVPICGSDLKGKPMGVMGHEFLGTVIECGPKVTSLKPGDMVSAMTRFPSQRCIELGVDCYDYCEMKVDRCPYSLYKSSTNGDIGVASQLLVMDERFLVRMPESLGVSGSLAEPIAVAVKSIQKLQNGTPMIRDCSVFGTGKIGSIVLLALRVSLGNEIVLRGYDIGKKHVKERFVESLGARYIDVLEEPIPKDAAEFIIVTADDPGLIPDIIAHAKPANARIVLMGYCEGKGNVEIPPDLWDKLVKDIDLLGSTNFNRMHMEEGARYLLKALDQYPAALETYITAIVPYKEYQRAFELAKSKEHLKILLEF